MTARALLPYRRACETYEFVHDGRRFFGSVGRTAGGDVAEVFVNVSGKVGSTEEALARDAAVSTSLALQHGVPMKVLRSAMTEVSGGEPAGPVARLLDLVTNGERV